MARVIAVNAQADRGLIGFETDSHLLAHAGIFRRDQEERRWFVLDDGVLTRTGLRPGTDGPFGKDAGEQKHEPWGPYGSEYQFLSRPCQHCAAGVVAVDFESEMRDLKHGHGTLLVDENRARVLHETFVPYVLKAPARTATIETDFGKTPVGWFPLTLTGAFTGRLGLFSGSADLSETYEGYRRFNSLDEAVAAFQTDTSPPPSS